MGTNSNQERLLSHASEIIRRKGRSLAGKNGFGPSDAEDIMQSLANEILLKAPMFDPEKGTEGQYISTIIRNAVATMVTQAKTAKRGFGFTFISLDEEINLEGDNTVTRHELVDKETYLQATRSSNTPQARQQDLRIDLERLFGPLPPDLKQLAEDLIDMTPSELARASKTPRTTINSRIKKLGEHLSNRGLEEYLKPLRHIAIVSGRYKVEGVVCLVRQRPPSPKE